MCIKYVSEKVTEMVMRPIVAVAFMREKAPYTGHGRKGGNGRFHNYSLVSWDLAATVT